MGGPRGRRTGFVEVMVSGVSGLGAAVIALGIVVARLTTSTPRAAEEVIAGVTIAGALIGGFVIAPYLNRSAWHARPRDHRDRSS